MSDAIKTINLDDVGGLQGQTKDIVKAAELMYRTQGGANDRNQSSVSGLTNASQATLSQMATAFKSGFGTSFTRVTDVFGDLNNSSRSRMILIGVAGVLLIGLLYFFSRTDEVPSTDESAMSEAVPQPESQPSEAQAAPSPEVKPESGPIDLANPYWSLPNPLENVPTAEQGVLTPGQEERWRQGLAHPFIWQRYKTVTELRAARLKGSQYLLTDALAQPKFWTRMEALLALAEMGEAVDIDSVEAGIGSTRRPLVQNYFRRFRQQATAGELYIMRQAVRIVGAGTRKIILENLLKHRDVTNELYLVAATYDPNPKVSDWIKEALTAQPLSEGANARFEQAAAAAAAAPAPEPVPSASPMPPAPDAAAPAQDKVQDLKVEEVPDDVQVEEVIFLKDEEKAPVAPVEDGFNELENENSGN